MIWSRRMGWIAAALLVLGTNGLVLGRVYQNRSGEPTSSLRVTERELSPEPGSWTDESTGSFLGIEVNPVRYGMDDPETWLDAAKLASLGFDVEQARSHFRDGLPWSEPSRSVFVAVELAGEAWQRHLQTLREELAALEAGSGGQPEEDAGQLEAKRAELDYVEKAGSRLYFVDADTDARSLRNRFPDRTRVAIAPATISLTIWQPGEEEVRVQGWIEQLLVSRVHLTGLMADQLSDLRRPGRDGPWPQVSPADSAPGPETPRYSLTLFYGRSFEPWIGDLRRGGFE